MGSGSALWHLEQIKQWMDNGVLNYSEFPGDLLTTDIPFNVVGNSTFT